MKKIFYYFISAILLTVVILLLLLITKGIETEKFNNIFTKKINQTNKNLNVELNKIKFKLDIKEISLFLQTSESKINYRNVIIPTENIKVYVDFISLLTSKPKIKKINLKLITLDIKKIKNISSILKPSNFSRMLANNLIEGEVNSELEFFLDDENSLDNFIAKGSIQNLKANVFKNIFLKETNLSFFADKSDILVKNIYGELDNIKINDGDIKINFSPEVSLKSNFKSSLNLKNKSLKKYFKNIKNFENIENLQSFNAKLNNSIFINFDETYKVKKYSFDAFGDISELNLQFKEPIIYDFLKYEIKNLFLKDSSITANFNSEKNNIDLSGKYSTENNDFLPFNLNSDVIGNLTKVVLDLKYQKYFEIELLNYKKPETQIADLSIELIKKKSDTNIKKLEFKENNNKILIENLKLENDYLKSIKQINVKTYNDKKISNDFTIKLLDKIVLDGNNFDASNLIKFIARPSKGNFRYLSKNIEINLKNILGPQSNKLSDFKLLGEIKKGKFVKISSKGDFGGNKFLDISMKNDKNNNTQYLEIYSDLPQPFLSEYNFFKGLTGGTLLFSSIIDNKSSSSKLKIENFKIINAPGLVKLLSLADLSGLADLAEGDGLSFDTLEINMKKEKGFLTLNEIYALGPSMSVIMEGYQDQKGLTSLRGTLVPAKNLNKIISKIPVIGNIVIPEEVGEGLFGISFKMKGPPGKIKTTINPIRTITPRFIQKILEKQKKTN
tara:strand:+ start:1970 stop:4156 length:2187 start_codon:yes stop_codon:yes gene_type:complete